MKKQVILIHGGDVFNTYEEYIKHLEKTEFDPNKDKKRGKRWSRNLEEELGNDFNVIFPTMPYKYNAKYREWKIWFEKVILHIKDNSILMGHSLGGLFLVKYLSENDFNKKISKTILIAAPYNDKNSKEVIGDFVLPDSLEKFKKQGGKIIIYQSKDDPMVPFSDFEKYKEMLPDAIVRVFKKRGHFTGNKFPELIRDIKGL